MPTRVATFGSPSAERRTQFRLERGPAFPGPRFRAPRFAPDEMTEAAVGTTQRFRPVVFLAALREHVEIRQPSEFVREIVQTRMERRCFPAQQRVGDEHLFAEHDHGFAPLVPRGKMIRLARTVRAASDASRRSGERALQIQQSRRTPFEPADPSHFRRHRASPVAPGDRREVEAHGGKLIQSRATFRGDLRAPVRRLPRHDRGIAERGQLAREGREPAAQLTGVAHAQ